MGAFALLCVLAACGGGGGADSSQSGVTQVVTSPDTRPVVVVGNAPVPAGASQYRELSDVPWASLAPGSRVMVAPGNYKGPIAIGANGTADKPITVEPTDATQRPVVDNSIDVSGASFIRISGLQIQSPQWGGFVVRFGSHDIALINNVIANAPIGIDVPSSAGVRLSFSQNLIQDAGTHGISIAVNGTAQQPNTISGNKVVRSGHHGMEIRGSYWVVEHNDVSYSGRLLSGTTGIHIYSANASEDSGDNNVIRYNASYANQDTGAVDGNGIQIDRWCDNNVVSFNLVWGNDGAGINVYGAKDNQVFSNTAMGNSLDPGLTHQALAEIVVGDIASEIRTSGNSIYNNIAVATRASVPAIYVDGRAYQQANRIGPNLAFNTQGRTSLRWGDSINLVNAADIDSATGTKGNLVEQPAFSNAAAPQTGGVKLTSAPSLRGTTLFGETDYAGASASPTTSFFGAYFFNP